VIKVNQAEGQKRDQEKGQEKGQEKEVGEMERKRVMVE